MEKDYHSNEQISEERVSIYLQGLAAFLLTVNIASRLMKEKEKDKKYVRRVR